MDLTICVGESCHLKGSEVVIKTFQNLIKKENLDIHVNLKGSFCMGLCSNSDVTVQINNEVYRVRNEDSEKFFYSTLLPLAKNNIGG